jgi:hypothetical protein
MSKAGYGKGKYGKSGKNPAAAAAAAGGDEEDNKRPHVVTRKNADKLVTPTPLATNSHPLPVGSGTSIALRRIPEPMEPHRRVDPESYRALQEYRDCIIISVPLSVMLPNADHWGAYNYSIAGRPSHIHAQELSFVLYALDSAVKHDGAQLRVFVELMVRDSCGLPRTIGGNVAAYPRERLISEVYDQANLVGYRFWVFLGTACYSPEVIFRRAVFRVQQEADWVPREVVASKLVYAVIRRPADREAKIREDAALEAAAYVLRESKRRQDAAAAGGGGGGGGGGEPGSRRRKVRNGDGDQSVMDEEEGVADELTIEAETERIAREYTRACRNSLPPAVVEKIARHQGNSPATQYLSVGSIQRYIQLVVQSTHLLTGSADTNKDLWGALPKLMSPWGECTWLPDVNEHSLSAAERWSFANSVSTFARYGTPVVEHACSEQLLPEYYTDEDGVWTVPFGHLVYELATYALDPMVLFPCRFPWVTVRFAEAVQRLKQLQLSEKSARVAEVTVRLDAAPPNVTDEIADATLFGRRAVLRSADEAAAEAERRERVHTLRREHLASVAFGGRRAPDASFDEAMKRLVERDEYARAELARDYVDEEWNAFGVEDRRTKTQQVINAAIPTYTRYKELLDAGLAAIDALLPPAGHRAPDVWRYEQRVALSALHRADTANALLGVICSSPEISEIHHTAYERISSSSRVDSFYQQQWSVAPQLTVAANAFLTTVMGIAYGKSMQHGHLGTAESIDAANLQATDPQVESAMHMLVYGQKGTGKSLTDGHVMQACLKGLFVGKNWQSKASRFTGNNDANKVESYDEAPPDLTDNTRAGQVKYAEQIAREKTLLSSNNLFSDRYVRAEGEDRAHCERLNVYAPSVRRVYTNEIRTERGVDGALLDRYDVILWAPSALNSIRMAERVNGLTDAERDKMWTRFCELAKDELAIKSMIVLWYRANIISSINTDVPRTMTSEAFDDSARYMPSLADTARANGRHFQYAVMMTIRLAYYTVFRSEASPLIRFVPPAVVDERTGEVLVPGYRHGVHKEDFVRKPAYFWNLITVLAPHLCAPMDIGLWQISRTVRIGYAFTYYFMARAIAASEANFRRAQLLPVYRRGKARLIDDELAERFAERDENGRTLPMFIEDLLGAERQFDHGVLQSNGADVAAMPRFQTLLASGRSAAFHGRNGRGGGGGSGGGGGGGDDKPVATDPNWISIPMSVDTLSSKAVGYLRRFYMMDVSQVRTAIGLIASNIHLLVPQFKRVHKLPREMTSHDLEFIRDVRDMSETPEIDYVTVPLIRDEGGEVLISTGGLMIPPQYLLALMLTSSENAHTRPRQTVIPLEVNHHSELVHAWTICRRVAKVTEMVNRSAVEKHLGAAYLQSSGMTAAPTAAETVLSKRVPDADPEKVAFRRHMIALNQPRTYHESIEMYKHDPVFGRVIREKALEIPSWQTPTVEQYDEMFELYMAASRAAPYAIDAARDEARRKSAFLVARGAAHDPPTDYPHINIVSAGIHRHLVNEASSGNSTRPLPRAKQITTAVMELEQEMAQLVVGAPETVAARNELVERVKWQRADGTVAKNYARAKHYVKTAARRLCSPAWYDFLRPYILAYDWHWAIRALSTNVYANEISEVRYDPCNPRTWLIYTVGPLAEQEPEGDHPSWSVRYLDLLGEWYAFRDETQRMAEFLTAHPEVTLINSREMCSRPRDQWDAAAQHAEIVQAKARAAARAEGAAMQEDSEQARADAALLDAYRLAKDRVRRVRASRLTRLVEHTRVAIAAERIAAEDVVMDRRPRPPLSLSSSSSGGGAAAAAAAAGGVPPPPQPPRAKSLTVTGSTIPRASRTFSGFIPPAPPASPPSSSSSSFLSGVSALRQ